MNESMSVRTGDAPDSFPGVAVSGAVPRLFRLRKDSVARLVYGDRVSIEVPIDQLFDDIGRWGFCYLLTVSDDQRPHLLALRPTAEINGDDRVLRFDAGGGRACRNAAARPSVSLVFPPAAHSDGMSLVVDGIARVDEAIVDVAPTWAVLHRAAP